MVEKQMLESLKKNKIAYGLLTKEEQKVLRCIGLKNLLVFFTGGNWKICNYKFFRHTAIYRVRPNYASTVEDKDSQTYYRGISTAGSNYHYPKRLEKIKILYEDDISYYVESFSEPVDSRGFRKRYSVKKHCHILESLIENSFCYKTLCVNTRPYMFLTEEEKEYLHQNESRVFILTAAGDWCNYANYSYSSNSVFRVI